MGIVLLLVIGWSFDFVVLITFDAMGFTKHQSTYCLSSSDYHEWLHPMLYRKIVLTSLIFLYSKYLNYLLDINVNVPLEIIIPRCNTWYKTALRWSLQNIIDTWILQKHLKFCLHRKVMKVFIVTVLFLKNWPSCNNTVPYSVVYYYTINYDRFLSLFVPKGGHRGQVMS